MGPTRGIASLAAILTKASPDLYSASAKIQLYQWADRFGWDERARQYDAAREIQARAKAAEVLNSGLALLSERVQMLKNLGVLIYNKYIECVMLDGAGTEVKELNVTAVRELRGVLDDIAKETGGRIQGVNITTSQTKLEEFMAGMERINAERRMQLETGTVEVAGGTGAGNGAEDTRQRDGSIVVSLQRADDGSFSVSEESDASQEIPPDKGRDGSTAPGGAGERDTGRSRREPDSDVTPA